MPLRLRFILDTNILIPLQDSFIKLQPNLANFVRLAGVGGHQLLYHAASESDILRDQNVDRRTRTLERLRQYTLLESGPACPWNNATTSANDACDNEILYTLENSAAHALVTEDQEIHKKAKVRGLGNRVFYIQAAEDWLRRLHERAQIVLPRIQDIELHTLTTTLADPFFDSIRAGYSGFDGWFHRKAQEGRRAWLYRDSLHGPPEALCIYAIQHDEQINEQGVVLSGAALKLCTFKVGELVRGRKIGELFLKAAFRYATDERCEHIFVHADPARHGQLIELLEDFGFKMWGSYKGDSVYVKEHPHEPPPLLIDAFDYLRRYFPHYRSDESIQKFLVPIQPPYHRILFPDYGRPGAALPAAHPQTHVGNAMKLAYLCHAPSNRVRTGDIVLFYRTHDLRTITSLGVVERYEMSQSATEIARLVSRRTVYSQPEIEEMATTPTKVMLFRLVQHLTTPIAYTWLRQNRVISGPIQSILRIDDESFSRILHAARG